MINCAYTNCVRSFNVICLHLSFFFKLLVATWLWKSPLAMLYLSITISVMIVEFLINLWTLFHPWNSDTYHLRFQNKKNIVQLWNLNFTKATQLNTILFATRKSGATGLDAFARILSIHHLHFPNAQHAHGLLSNGLLPTFFRCWQIIYYVDSTPLSPLRNDDGSHDGTLASTVSFELVPSAHTTLP